jgi:hypothetical protein
MATGNTSLLGLALPVEGELSGTWGDVVNDSITSLVDSAVAGTTTLSADSDVTLTTTALVANQARQAIIRWTASNGATTRNITAPAQSKPYIVINAGTGSIVLRGAGPTAGITIVAGERCLAAWSGSDFVKIATTAAGAAAGSNTQVQFNSSGNLAGSSALTFDGTTLSAPGTVISANTSTNALRITQTGSGNALLVEDSANPDSTPVVVTTDGRAVIGHTAAITGPGSNTSGLQTHSTSVFQMGYGGTYWAADANGAGAYLAKSRGAAIGTRGIVSSGDATGRFTFAGDDGTNFLATAWIESSVDGTPGTNDMPGRLVFSTTADGASTPTERMRIDNAGNVAIGTSSTSGGRLSVFSGTSATQISVANSSGSSEWQQNGNDLFISNYNASGAAIFRTNGTERMRIDSAGNTLIGTTTNTNASRLVVNGTISETVSGVQYQVVSQADIGSAPNEIPLNQYLGSAAYVDINYFVTPSADNTFTGTQSFTGTSSKLAMVLNDAAEVATVSAIAATGTINYDITTQSVVYYTSNASANWTVNFRASSGTTLNAALATGQSVTVAFLVTQGSTAYFNNAVQVDGTATGVTTRWLGGAPTAGNASGIDSYRYLIIKTGSATYTVLASVTQFKA